MVCYNETETTDRPTFPTVKTNSVFREQLRLDESPQRFMRMNDEIPLVVIGLDVRRNNVLSL